MKTVSKIETRGGWNKGKRYSIGTRNGGYHAIHKWLVKYYGNANQCENINCASDSQMFHWALIKGKQYEHKRENFMMLCASCHKNYDMTPELKDVLSASKEVFKRKVGQFDNYGRLIKEWLGINYLCRETGFNKGNISRCLSGDRKTAHGFIWRFI